MHHSYLFISTPRWAFAVFTATIHFRPSIAFKKAFGCLRFLSDRGFGSGMWQTVGNAAAEKNVRADWRQSPPLENDGYKWRVLTFLCGGSAPPYARTGPHWPPPCMIGGPAGHTPYTYPWAEPWWQVKPLSPATPWDPGFRDLCYLLQGCWRSKVIRDKRNTG